MWPFSLYARLRKSEHLLDLFRKANTEQFDRITQLENMFHLRGTNIVSLRQKIFALEDQLLTSSAVILESRNAFAGIADHGTKYPNGTVQRMARQAMLAVDFINTTAPLAFPTDKAKSSAAEEMVKAA